MGFENDVLVCNNVNFNANAAKPHLAQVTSNGQLLIGSGIYPNIQVGTLTSPLGTITIGYSSPNITIDTSDALLNYTNVTHAQSPYSILATDNYISVDCSAGVVTLNFPNGPIFKKTWIVKDRTGNASANNISISTLGGVDTIDGQTTYKIISNFGAVNLLANASNNYEVF